eukprot:6031718-Amphidinium_carterae.1
MHSIAQVTEKTRCDVAQLICKSFHRMPQDRPSFVAVSLKLRRVRLSIEKASPCSERLWRVVC